MSSTTQITPNAAEYAKRIGDLFAKISWDAMNQAQLINMATERCKSDCNTPDGVGALVYALDSSKDAAYELVCCNLRDTVNLLLERVKELEATNV